MFTVTEETLGQPYGNTQTPYEKNVESHAIIAAEREAGQQAGLLYSGDVTPEEAWKLFSRDVAILIDVRTIEERKSVGYVPDASHVPWTKGVSMERNPRFIRELESKAGKLDVILFLCRSGGLSFAAAEAASKVGFKNVFNVLEGFEGEAVNGQNGFPGGWRSYGLPWIKD